MSNNAPPPPIIVIKKKGGHAGHHGGAWKVAYADFVTAMMALFIVLWLLSSSEKVKKAVAGYFNDPKGTGNLLGTLVEGKGDALEKAPTKDLEKLKEKIEKEIKERKDLEKVEKQIEIKITPEGLRIELLEGKNGTFFQSGSARLSEDGQKLLAMISGELKNLPNNLLIEGHTDSTPYSNSTEYTNWELSADRANSARRLMQADGVRPKQVTQVRGYSDQLPRDGVSPSDSSNRRISILVKKTGEDEHPKIVKADSANALKIAKPAPPAPEKPKAAEGAKPEEHKAAEPAAKPAAAQPAAKSGGVMDKIKGLVPGKK